MSFIDTLFYLFKKTIYNHIYICYYINRKYLNKIERGGHKVMKRYEVWVAGRIEMELYKSFKSKVEAIECAKKCKETMVGTVIVEEVITNKIKF